MNPSKLTLAQNNDKKSDLEQFEVTLLLLQVNLSKLLRIRTIFIRIRLTVLAVEYDKNNRADKWD
ncbi:hypothetical protein GCM10008018_58660 [Paenibacillus marchantiophytorum]|uniref:Uncharacterized protein n=1 Tax=Paenibacillus marchantiophytorum TaxID=1619310 RepID=A0ABQ1FAU7_9BACL|nr:hypothetical protein GCM10008018_58660 [Paenibacillus marchantiophytorum]